jgi:hypothetical protein
MAKKKFTSDRSNIKEVAKLICHSPEMQRLASNPDAAREYLIGVLETARKQHQGEQRHEMERQKKKQQQKGRGFELG